LSKGFDQPTHPTTQIDSIVVLGDAQNEDVMMKVFPINCLAAKML